MYSVGESLPLDDLDAGAYLLSGPAMSGKYDLLVSFAVEGITNRDGALFVSTNENANGVLADVEDSLDEVPDHFRLVDCVSDGGGDNSLPATQVEYVSSPGDLTGIGIAVSEQLRRFNESDVDRTRVVFYSLSTLLMYADLETIFRFLHVVTGRIGGIDAVGLFAVDPTTHEESTVNTLKQLFDGMIELRRAGDGREARMVGLGDGPSEWVSHP